MPCQSDYLAQSGQEAESKRVCELLAYLYEKAEHPAPDWVTQAADNYYGNLDRLDEATRMLCERCRLLTTLQADTVIYNAHDATARRLASWWERHQEWDKRRVEEEKETRRGILLKERALQKLTVDEIKALGLVPK